MDKKNYGSPWKDLSSVSGRVRWGRAGLVGVEQTRHRCSTVPVVNLPVGRALIRASTDRLGRISN